MYLKNCKIMKIIVFILKITLGLPPWSDPLNLAMSIKKYKTRIVIILYCTQLCKKY